MHTQTWIVRVILGTGAVLIAASDLIFAGGSVSSPFLMLVGGFTFSEGLRSKPKPGDKD